MLKGEHSEFPGGLVVKDPVSSVLWLGFYPWLREFPHVSGTAKKKKREREPRDWFGTSPRALVEHEKDLNEVVEEMEKQGCGKYYGGQHHKDCSGRDMG